MDDTQVGIHFVMESADQPASIGVTALTLVGVAMLLTRALMGMS